MTKLFIKNRKGQKICVVIDKANSPKGLAIIAHGLSGNKDEIQIQKFAEIFGKKGYTTVRFDTTNTFGESDGDYEKSTVTSYQEDLEDVVAWCKSQEFYIEPFVLLGHSIGGMTCTLYAEENPKEIKALAPIATVVSGSLSMQTPKYQKTRMNWEKDGYIIEKSSSSHNLEKRLPWSHMQDRLKYDILVNAYRLSMPVICIVGDNDEATPINHQKMFYEKLPGRKEFHIVKNAIHTLRKPENLEQIEDILSKWIDSFE